MASKSFAVREFNVERRSIPLAIQTYFWQQISPLLKTKLEKKEYESASESLKNVICDNNLQGLPSAFKSVPRWFFVHSSLAYIIQCCSALLSNRHQLGYFDRLTNPERDLIYTLHWILFEASGICGIEETENLLHPISTVELFVHLLIPHVFKIKEKDLINKLEGGLALWNPLQNHQTPLLPAFCHPVSYKDPNAEDFVSQSLDTDNSARNSRSSDVGSKKSVPAESVFSSATFFDVAVLRCLLSSGWYEEGVYWSLIYIGDYLRREYALPGAKEKQKFTSASKTSWGTQGGGDDTGSLDSFGGCVLNDPGPSKPPDPTPTHDVQINIINEDNDDNDDDEPGASMNQTDLTERKSEDIKLTIEDDDVTKLIVPDDHQNVAELRIRVDSPVLDGRRPVFSVSETDDKSKETCSDKGQVSSQPFYSISVTPSTPTVEIVNEVNPGSTNEGFDYNNHKLGDANGVEGDAQSNDEAVDTKKADSSESHAAEHINKSSEKDTSKVAAGDKSSSLNSESGSNTCTTGYSNSTTSSCDSKVLDVDKTLMNHFTLVNNTGSSSELSLESVSSLGDQAVLHGGTGSSDTLDKSISSITSLLESEDRATEKDLAKKTHNKNTIEQQSSLSSDEPPVDTKQGPSNQPASDTKTKSSKVPDHKSETASSDFPVSDNDKHSLVRDSSTETQDTAEAISLQPSLGNFRRSARGLIDSMFRNEHYLVFPGVEDYVTTDGRLSVIVLLQAINGVLKENLSGRVCQMALRVLELLNVIVDKEKEKRRTSSVPIPVMDDKTVTESMAIGARIHQTDTILSRLRTTFYGRPPTIHMLSSGCGFRLIRALGCPSGCGEGCHAYKGDILRDQSNAYLANLHKQDDKSFKSWLYNYARIEPVEDLVNFLHALVGFCDECNPFAVEEEDSGNKTSKGKLFSVKEGVEGVILDAILKPLVSRVAEMKLTELDALTFYGELRQLLRYIKDNYGGVFWKVAMSGLMDCAYKGKKEEADAVSKSTIQTPLLNKERVAKKEGSMSKGDKMTPKTTRRKFFKGQKFGRTTDGSESDLRALGTSSVSSNKTLDGTSLEETMSPRSKRKIFSLGAWRKQRVIGQNYDSDDDNLDDSPDASMQQISLKKKLFKERSRKRLDDVFPMKSGKKLVTSSSSSLPDNGSPTVDIVMRERRPVDIESLRHGLIRLRFLMNASQPGAVPDPHIVAAMLDLHFREQIEAPAIARASLLLECSHLVYRCNRGEWPTWLRGSHPSLAKRKRNAPKEISLSTPRRNLVAMHEAGKLFHSWGVALGQKLEIVLKNKRQSLPSIQEEEGKSRVFEMLEEDLEEDFLDEGTLSQTCPYALKMIACQLLIEITAFLRESHGLYQIRRDSKGMQNRARGRRSFGGAAPRKAKPVIIFPDQEGKSADDSMILGRRASDVGKERKLSDVGPHEFVSSPKRSSLHLPRSSLGSSSPKLNKSPRSSVGFGSDFIVQPKKKRGTIKAKRQSGPDATPYGTHDEDDDSEDDETTRFPWLNAVTILNSFTSYLCDHQTRCPSNCHQRQTRLCARLVKALQNVYSGLAGKPAEKEREKPDKLDKSKSKTGFNLTNVHVGSPQHSVSGFDPKGKPDEAMLDYIKSKIPPPKVDFTLPSPLLGSPANHAPDCPWDPVMMLEEQPGNQKSKNKDKKKVKEAVMAEIKRKQREGFPLRTLPVSLEATMGSNDEDKAESGHQVNAELWPSALSSAIPHIIKLLDDVLVDSNKTAVMEVAYRIIWNCLVEDPVLFFRTILEDITKRDKQEELVALIRKLFMYVDKLPPISARFLLNNLVGVVMYYARTNRAGAQDSVALILSLTWEEMTFGKVITYLRSRFTLDEPNLYLIDTKSDQILEERDFVRDVFAFRKGFPSPQLKLDYVEHDKAFLKRQEQAFTNKLSDTGRIMLSLSILKALPNQKHSAFLHEEFCRQTSFPRNALASDFGLYGNGAKGNELFGLDVIHKMYWVQVHPKCLFALLNSLDVSTPDNLDILELVYDKKPLQPLDSCYADATESDGETKVDEAIRLCVTVVDFAPESKRAAQMLVVLSAILPYYLEFLSDGSATGDMEKVKQEGQAITSLSTLIKVLIKSSDVLTRSFVHFQTLKSMTDRTHMQHSSWQSTTSLNISKGSISSFDAPQCDDDEEDGEARHGRPLLERLRAQEEKNEVLEALEEYRKPRNALLVLVADYVSICTPRVEEIRKTLPPRFVIPDLLDDISIILLAEIMYSLMKLAVYDPVTMCSPGVQRYMLQALPLIDWLPEAIEPAVNLVLKRLSKIFDKLIQKPDLVSLVSTCMSFVLEERPSITISLTAFLPMAPISSPPPFFCETIMRLASRLMFLLKNDYTLQELCGGSSDFGYPIRTEKVFVRILLPILIRLGSRRPESPKASPDDVVFALKCFLRVVTTKNSDTPALPPVRLSFIEDDPEAARAMSLSEPYTGGTHIDTIPDSLYTAAYLGLKILVICFEDELSTEWFTVFHTIDRIVDNHVEELSDLKNNKTKKDEEEATTISLNPPPSGHPHGKGKTENIDDESGSKSNKKTVTFSSEIKHEGDSAVDGESNRTNQDQRRKKWIMNKQPLFEAQEGENNDETFDSPFGHKRGTGYKGKKAPHTENLREARKHRLGMLPSSFSQDVEVGTLKETSEELEMKTLQTSSSVPVNLDQNQDDMTLERTRKLDKQDHAVSDTKRLSGPDENVYGMDESDEEFLDAMSEWPKEVALAMQRLNSPDAIKENDVEWDSDGIDDIIPMYPSRSDYNATNLADNAAFLRDRSEDETTDEIDEILLGIGTRNRLPEYRETRTESESDDYDTDLEESIGLKQTKTETNPTQNKCKDVYSRACRDLGIVPASIFLKQCDTSSIELKHYGVGFKGARAVAMAMKYNQTVQTLNLHDNDIREAGIRDICDMMTINVWLTKLDLSGNSGVGKTGLTAMANMIEQAVMLKTLNLSGCKLQGIGVQGLISCLASNHRLETLDLSSNEIGDTGAVCFETVLSKNRTLSSLNLSCNAISFLGLEPFCNGLSQNSTLEELNLSLNGIANHGAECMSIVLGPNKSLKVLDLQHNHISMTGIESVAKSLRRNTSLQVLKIGKNPFLASGASVLLNSLQENPDSSLRELILDGIAFNKECTDEVSILTTQNPLFVCKWDGSIRGGSVMEGEQQMPMELLLMCINEQGFRLLDFYRYLTNDNDSGVLTRENFISGTKKRNFPFGEKELASLFDFLDTKGCGSISYDQFLSIKNDVKQTKLKQERKSMAGYESPTLFQRFICKPD
ncbi:hypothetical protein QZH41_000981 [Actinostola sp. cb2023]|nr:hypothetical protein QZH41_000981 [Actinostola sp. cb2023]